MRRIVRSPFGLCLQAIRENPEKAAASALPWAATASYAFVIAGVFGAVGGALLGVPTGLADPLLAYWTHSGNLVFMLAPRAASIISSGPWWARSSSSCCRTP